MSNIRTIETPFKEFVVRYELAVKMTSMQKRQVEKEWESLKHKLDRLIKSIEVQDPA